MSWHIRPVTFNIRKLRLFFDCIIFEHVRMEANQVADWLASYASSCDSFVFSPANAPMALQDVLLTDSIM